METTGLKDKNGTEIMVGDKVRFKCYGRYWTETVSKMSTGYYPFNPYIRVDTGFYIKPSDCEIIK